MRAGYLAAFVVYIEQLYAQITISGIGFLLGVISSSVYYRGKEVVNHKLKRVVSVKTKR